MLPRWPFLETERKYLVLSESWRTHVRMTSRIKQSYFYTFPGVTARIRQIGKLSLITCKTLPVGGTRGEIEFPVASDMAKWLFKFCPRPPIEKERHLVSHAGATWEIDVFLGRHKGLVVAEIELNHPSQPVVLPAWVGREVTKDPLYRNSVLYRTDNVPAPTD